MSQTSFEEIFAKFKENFPPVDTPDQATLKLTTQEFLEMIQHLDESAQVPSEGMFSFLKAQGYIYHPTEYNETVTFYWLVKEL